MLDRSACERRVYRLATLLAGNPVAATTVIEAVVEAQPDLGNLDSAHLDRLTVLRSREVEPTTLDVPELSSAVAAALASLTGQGREAWVLFQVYRVPLRETARAMDCSVTAITRHLRQAQESMAAALGEQLQSASRAILDYSMSLEVPAFYRARQRRRRRLRQAAVVAAIGFGLLAVMIAARWLAAIPAA